MMEAHESHELIEQSEEHGHSSKKWTALLISIFAMVLAINNVGGGNATKEATKNNILASNVYAFYQAKSIRQSEYKIAVNDLLLRLEQDPKMPEGVKTKINEQIEDYKKTIERYESDPVKKEGKVQLLEKAKELEQERDHALAQDPMFDYAEGILQIAIVLLSISIIANLGILLLVGSGLGLLGTLLMFNGFFLVIV